MLMVVRTLLQNMRQVSRTTKDNYGTRQKGRNSTYTLVQVVSERGSMVAADGRLMAAADERLKAGSGSSSLCVLLKVVLVELLL